MDLHAILTDAVDQIFLAFESLQEDITFVRLNHSGFDPDARKPIVAQELVTVKGIFHSQAVEDVQNNEKRMDVAVLLKFDAISFEPNNDDRIRARGREWGITLAENAAYQNKLWMITLKDPA